MATITVSANDTAQAMDQIVAKLGADAMIIDTIKRGNKVEMIATNEPDDQVKMLRNPVKKSRAFDSETTIRPLMKSLAKPDELTGNLLEELPSFTDVFDQHMLLPQTAETAESSGPMVTTASHFAALESEQGPSAKQFEMLQGELAQMRSMLNGMVITQVDQANTVIGRNAAVRLRQAGFSQEVIHMLRDNLANMTDDAACEAFCEALSTKLVRDDVDRHLGARLICVVGASGAGKTTLTSKIAAYCKGLNKTDRIIMGAATETGSEQNDRVKEYARLMNMKSTSFAVEELGERIRETSQRMILDVSANPEAAVAAISAAARNIGVEKVTVVQAIAGGSSATMITNQCALYHDLQPIVALTKLDECEAMPAELSALVTAGSDIGLLTGTKSIVGGIAIATNRILTQYLKENTFNKIMQD